MRAEQVPRSPRPHLHRDRAHPAHICTGTGAHPAHICTAGPGLTPPTSAPGPGLTRYQLTCSQGGKDVQLKALQDAVQVLACPPHASSVGLTQPWCLDVALQHRGTLRATCISIFATQRRALQRLLEAVQDMVHARTDAADAIKSVD